MAKHVLRSMMIERSRENSEHLFYCRKLWIQWPFVYSATKAALLGFTRSLAREVGPLGITVNAIAPGFIATEMTQDLAEVSAKQLLRGAH